VIGGVAGIAAVYVLVNVALLHVLPAAGIAGSQLPAADAARTLFGPAGGTIATVLCIVSLPATLNSALLCATRIPFAMGRDRLFWPRAGSVNRQGTPAVSMALSAALGILLAVSGTFEQLLTWVGVLNCCTYCAALGSLLVLRVKEPRLPRPFTARPYPWLSLAALAGGIAMLAGSAAGDPRTTLQALALIAAGLPVYVYSRLKSSGRA
jgi:basic amino acid/polyamine antiporter, APA family